MASQRNLNSRRRISAEDLVFPIAVPQRSRRGQRAAARRQDRSSRPGQAIKGSSRRRTAVPPRPVTQQPDWEDTPLQVAIVTPTARRQITYREWFRQNVLRSRWLMWFVTMYVHLLLLLTLAAVCIHHPDLTDKMVLTMTFDGDVEPLDPQPLETEAFNIEPPQDAEAPPEPTPRPDLAALLPEREEVTDLLTSVVEHLRSSAPTAPATAHSEGSETAPPAAKPKPANPAPQYAVTAGSFSVWTEPANPAPDEPYRIVVQIRMPEGTTRYNLRDLDGVVIGSDGYRKPIPGFQRAILPVINGYVRYEVPVVSADAMVEDIVFIRSRMLREAQRLQLRF